MIDTRIVELDPSASDDERALPSEGNFQLYRKRTYQMYQTTDRRLTSFDFYDVNEKYTILVDCPSYSCSNLLISTVLSRDQRK